MIVIFDESLYIIFPIICLQFFNAPGNILLYFIFPELLPNNFDVFFKGFALYFMDFKPVVRNRTFFLDQTYFVSLTRIHFICGRFLLIFNKRLDSFSSRCGFAKLKPAVHEL